MDKIAKLAECLGAGAKNLLLGANLGSLRFLTAPQKAYRYWNACLFLRNSFAGRGLPESRMQDVFPDLPSGPVLRFPEVADAWRLRYAGIEHRISALRNRSRTYLEELGSRIGFNDERYIA